MPSTTPGPVLLLLETTSGVTCRSTPPHSSSSSSLRWLHPVNMQQRTIFKYKEGVYDLIPKTLQTWNMFSFPYLFENNFTNQEVLLRNKKVVLIRKMVTSTPLKTCSPQTNWTIHEQRDENHTEKLFLNTKNYISCVLFPTTVFLNVFPTLLVQND